MNKNTKKYKKNIKKRIHRDKKQKTKKLRRYLAFSSIGAIGLLFILGLVLPGLPIQFWSNDIPDGDIVIGGFPCQGFSLANLKRMILHSLF